MYYLRIFYLKKKDSSKQAKLKEKLYMKNIALFLLILICVLLIACAQIGWLSRHMSL